MPRLNSMKDETGNRYNRLTVVGVAPGRHKTGYRWLCKCDCGTEKAIPGTGLRNGSYQSCGCLARENSINNPSKASLRESSLRRMFLQYKQNCNKKNRSVSFNLTESEFEEIVTQKCYYCGRQPREAYTRRKYKVGERLLSNGVDRVDSSLGYSLDNCVPCCSVCNLGKMDLSQGDFIRMCYSVVALHEQRSRLYGGEYAN